MVSHPQNPGVELVPLCSLTPRSSSKTVLTSRTPRAGWTGNWDRQGAGVEEEKLPMTGDICRFREGMSSSLWIPWASSAPILPSGMGGQHKPLPQHLLCLHPPGPACTLAQREAPQTPGFPQTLLFAELNDWAKI